MKSTLDISQAVLDELEKLALSTGRSRDELVEEAVVLFLRRRRGSPDGRACHALPVSSETGGLRPGVDLSRNARLRTPMDGR